jgi:hypothetical protein
MKQALHGVSCFGVAPKEFFTSWMVLRSILGLGARDEIVEHEIWFFLHIHHWWCGSDVIGVGAVVVASRI